MEGLAVRLDGSLALLEPLDPGHADDLRRASRAPEIWSWLASLDDPERFDEWLELSLEAAAAGREGIFAIRDRRSGEIVGSSRYMNVRPADRALEIGWTWLNPAAWRSGINVEAKLLFPTFS